MKKKPLDQLLYDLGRAGFEGAYIAGGFVRDSALGVQPKDVDIFFPKAGNAAPLGLISRDRRWIRTYGDKYAPLVEHVFTNKLEYELPVQLIMVDHTSVPKFVRNYFDWGLCKCYTRVSTGETSFTEQFMEDSEHKVHRFYYNPEFHNLHTALAHGARLYDKYPWPMEVIHVTD